MADAPQSNQDFAWARFDPEAYVQHYYADPHPDDDRVVRLTAQALAGRARELGRADLSVIDVGTGPNLFPLFAALPVAATLTGWEFSEANVGWLRKTLAAGKLKQPWPHFWSVAQRAQGRADGNPMLALRRRAEIVQGSIFDLPRKRFDAATMFFCAESITAQQSEFERACARFAGCVRPGGVLAAAFLAGSRGYRVGQEDFPALSVQPDTLRRAFRPYARAIRVARIGAWGEEIRSGYSGMLFLTARAR